MDTKKIVNSTLTELYRALESKELTSVDIVKAFKQVYEDDSKHDTSIHGYVEFFDDAIEKAREMDDLRSKGEKKPLLGLPLAIKDNISIKGKLCTCCSKILEGYIAPFNATVIERLVNAGAVILGRTNMDEFAMGSSTEFSCYGPSRNPYDRTRTPGGSSGGSAAVVAANQAPASLGTETGGSVRLPASYCGLYGLKPTYGLLSRYGVTAFSSTVDQVGLFTKSPDDMGLLLSVLAGKDPEDLTSLDVDFSHLSSLKAYTKDEISKLRFLTFTEFIEADGVSSAVKTHYNKVIDWICATGAKIETVSLPILKSTIDEYYVLTFPDAASNLARFDGIRYGSRVQTDGDTDELYVKTRTEKLGPEVKRRILIGNYCLTKEFTSDIYDVGKKVQAIFEKQIDNLMEDYDIILCPSAPTTAFKLGEKVDDPVAMYLSDLFTNFANLARIPSLSVPMGFSEEDKLPLGVQFASGKRQEEKILRLASSWHQAKKDDTN